MVSGLDQHDMLPIIVSLTFSRWRNVWYADAGHLPLMSRQMAAHAVIQQQPHIDLGVDIDNRSTCL